MMSELVSEWEYEMGRESRERVCMNFVRVTSSGRVLGFSNTELIFFVAFNQIPIPSGLIFLCACLLLLLCCVLDQECREFIS